MTLAPFPSTKSVSASLRRALLPGPIPDTRPGLSRALPRAFGYYGASVAIQDRPTFGRPATGDPGIASSEDATHLGSPFGPCRPWASAAGRLEWAAAKGRRSSTRDSASVADALPSTENRGDWGSGN